MPVRQIGADLTDYTAKEIGEIEAIAGGGFRRARAALGVRSFGMQILEFPPNFTRYGEHDHSGSNQEEVYIALRGSGEIDIDGSRVALDPETLVRVGPTARRKIYSGPEGLRLLALGGVPGEPYRPPAFTELGAPDLLAELPTRRLRPLLADPRCPGEPTERGRRIALDEFVRFASEQLALKDTPGLDERLDQFLTHMGGRVVGRTDAGPIFELPESSLSAGSD